MTEPFPDSSLQDMAAKANEAILGDTPSMAPAPNLTIPLPVGYEGHRSAVVRELNGNDEEALSSFDASAGEDDDRFSFLLGRALVSVGPLLSAETPNLVRQLTIGDRNAVFLGTIRATYGDLREFKVKCSNPECGERLDVQIDLSDEFPMITAEDVGVKPDGTIDVPLRDGSTAVLRLPTAGIYDEVRSLLGKVMNPGVFNTQMIARCIVELRDSPTKLGEHTGDRVKWAGELGMSHRNRIVQALTVDQPGPRMEEVSVPCEACGVTLTVPMDWALLLYA